MGRLQGKVAVITGATTGIGLASAKRFAAEGALVFMTGRRKTELDAAVAAVGTNARGIQGDISKMADLDRLFDDRARARPARSTFCSPMPAGGEFAPLGAISEEHFDKTFATNVKGTLFTVQKALPLLKDGGSIILTGSTTATTGTPAFSVYSASKAAIRNFARTWILDLAPRKIRVNVLVPGATSTPGWHNLATSDEAHRQMVSFVEIDDAPWAVSASPTKWPARRCSWPPTKAASSPEASSSSTAARPRSDARQHMNRSIRSTATARRHRCSDFSRTAGVLAIAAILGATALSSQSRAETVSAKPTIVLVHGAFADSSSWNDVVSRLLADGYAATAAALPLRSVKGDANSLARLVASIPGPVVLVGHSYGGEVISVAAEGNAKVKALVFVAGLAPDVGESAATLADRFPTGTLGPALAAPVPQGDGESDLYIQQGRFWQQFAADVPEGLAKEMAVAQRPVTEAALNEPVARAGWKAIPSWFIYGSLDKNIPAALHAFMAQRAGAKEAVEVAGASHVVMMSHAPETAAMIERAASAP